MIKKFYVMAWILLIGSALVSAFSGTFDAFAMVSVSIAAAALVYGLALWSVFRDPQSAQSQ
jgi:hypothetical protein